MNRKLVKSTRFVVITVLIALIAFNIKPGSTDNKGLSALITILYKENSDIYQYVEWKETVGNGNMLFGGIFSSSPVSEYILEAGFENQMDCRAISVENKTVDSDDYVLNGMDSSEEVPEGQEMDFNNVSFIQGETYQEVDNSAYEAVQTVSTNVNNTVKQLRETQDFNFLMKNFYIVDSTTSIDKNIFPVKELLGTDMSIQKDNSKPQILIYHTHATSEAFADSRAGVEDDSVVGLGNLLTKILTEQYGFNVIHDKTKYDLINGSIDRSRAYNAALDGVAKELNENKDLQVVIDLHRDGIRGSERPLTKIDNKDTATFMFFNGLSRNREGEIPYLNNPFRFENLAFSLQLKCKSMELYPGLTKPIYLKGYRYNLNLAKRSLLIEVGNQNNTVADVKNAMAPLAKVLDEVLSKKQ